MFTGGMRERSEKTIKIYDVDTTVSSNYIICLNKYIFPSIFFVRIVLDNSKIFSEFLKFIYCGKFDDKIMQERTVEVLSTANKVN